MAAYYVAVECNETGSNDSKEQEKAPFQYQM